jgi:hypothetical protein
VAVAVACALCCCWLGSWAAWAFTSAPRGSTVAEKLVLLLPCGYCLLLDAFSRSTSGISSLNGSGVAACAPSRGAGADGGRRWASRLHAGAAVNSGDAGAWPPGPGGASAAEALRSSAGRWRRRLLRQSTRIPDMRIHSGAHTSQPWQVTPVMLPRVAQRWRGAEAMREVGTGADEEDERGEEERGISYQPRGPSRRRSPRTLGDLLRGFTFSPRRLSRGHLLLLVGALSGPRTPGRPTAEQLAAASTFLPREIREAAGLGVSCRTTRGEALLLQRQRQQDQQPAQWRNHSRWEGGEIEETEDAPPESATLASASEDDVSSTSSTSHITASGSSSGST